MTIADTRTPAYTPVARTLHWIVAVLILGLIPVGILMGQMEASPLQDRLYNLHRSTGALILPLAIIRLVYRLTHPLPAIQKLAAESVHWGLYALIIVQPLVGWAATSAYRAPIIIYGLFELPPILAENRALSEQLFTVHRVLGILMALMVLAHIGAALFHHFVRKDRVLMRMVSGA